MSKQKSSGPEDKLIFPDTPKNPEKDSPPALVASEADTAPDERLEKVQSLGQDFRRKIPQRKLYQDEIYGSKELSPLAVALIDTPEFQRLGHIYQLGMTHTIFRGANHRRLDHSVGTYFMSRTLMRRIVQNHARLHRPGFDAFAHPGRCLSLRLYLEAPGTAPEDQHRYSPMGRWRGLSEVVSAAALLHDLAHVAVGHTLEDEFSVFDKHDGLGGSRLFELLYGPRNPKKKPDDSERPIDRFFEPIDQERLPPPNQHDFRIPLPWVFEDGTYDRFLPDQRPVQSEPIPVKALSNWEIRDLIYLILSFKETIGEDKFWDFDEEFEVTESKMTKENDHTGCARLSFIKQLRAVFSKPLDLGDNYENKPLFHPFMSDIVSNTICADLLDYLVRDGQRLRLDIRNNPRLQRYLVIRPESSFVKSHQNGGSMLTKTPPELRLTINAVYLNGLPRRDTVSDLLDLMRERYRFAEVVYYHPKKCAFSTMVARALELAPYSPKDGTGIYPAPWSSSTKSFPRTQPHIAHFGDESLLAYLDQPSSTKSDPKVAALVRRINYRDEYRLLFTLDYKAANEAGGSPRKIIDHLRKKGNHDVGRKEWEQVFAKMLGESEIRELIDDGLPPILIYCPNIRMQAKEVAARVELMPDRVIPLNQQHEDQTLRQEMEVLNNKYKQLWRLYLFVHPRLAPIGEDRKEEKVTFLNAIVDAFCEHYGVKSQSRSRGARFEYKPFLNRREDYFRAHGKNLLAKVLPTESSSKIEDRIRHLAGDLGLWSVALDRQIAPFPVSAREYDTGLAYAIVVAAAENAEQRQRDEWPEALQQFQAPDWHREARTPSSDTARLVALSEMKSIAADLFQPQKAISKRNPVDSWHLLIQRVSNAVKNS